uniref:Pecanex-like protein n=1 Tax=Mesocestoides corti TaxID=53468 RepID=A0A5K3FT64_MESCO
MAGKHLFYRPFDSISDLLPLADRKAVKYSFYNIVSVICLFSVFLLCTAIFLVLRVFLRPILWALVVGTCLFPCKSGVTAYFRRFLKRQKENSYPFCLSVFLFPFKFFQSSISTLFDALWPKVIPFIIVFLSTGAFMFLHDFGLFALFGLFLSTIYSLLSDVLALISFVSSLRVITALSVVLIFTTKVVHLYTIQGNMIILIMRYIIFIMIFSCCGVLQPVFIIALFLLLICSRIFSDADSATGNPSTILGSSDAHSTPSCTTASALLRRLSLLPSNDSQAPTLNTVSSADNAVGSRSPTVGFASSSSALVQGCFTGLGLIHFSVAFWTRTWFFRLVLLFGTLGLVAYAVTRLQLVQKALSLIKQTWTPLERKSISLLLPGTDDGRESLFLPTSLKVALRWAGKFDQNLYVIVDEYLDYLVSLVLISLMVLITVLITFFLAVQVGLLSVFMHLFSMFACSKGALFH